jgi:hypothetical protein
MFANRAWRRRCVAGVTVHEEPGGGGNTCVYWSLAAYSRLPFPHRQRRRAPKSGADLCGVTAASNNAGTHPPASLHQPLLHVWQNVWPRRKLPSIKGHFMSADRHRETPSRRRCQSPSNLSQWRTRMVRAVLVIASLIAVGVVVLSKACAQTTQAWLVCVGENQQICSGRFPNASVQQYGCGDTGPNAICYRYCGKAESPTTCSQTRRGGPDQGGRCGYSWVEVRCYGN